MQSKDKILGWTITDIKDLLHTIKQKNYNNLVQAFQEFADKTNRKTFSVRNFYYKLIKEYDSNPNIKKIIKANKLDSDLKTNHFSDSETNILLRKLLRFDRKESIRQSCMELANGDTKKMIRYQNKFRNLLKKEPEKVRAILDEYKQKNIKTRDIRYNNIVMLPKKKVEPITQNEIQSLFWGLVRLVKKSAQDEIEQNLIREAEFANSQLEKSLIDLRRKNILIKELKEQNEKLKERIAETQKNLQSSQEKMLSSFLTLNTLATSSKIEELKSFINSLVVSEQKTN